MSTDVAPNRSCNLWSAEANRPSWPIVIEKPFKGPMEVGGERCPMGWIWAGLKGPEFCQS
jgi:hypothetical protein